MNPKISVIISVWNGEKYLGEAIESILQQTYLNKELIIVDDGSTDGTQKVIESFGKWVISMYQKNQGLGAGRNTGAALSQGTHLAFLDHDDLWTPTKLELQVQALTKEDRLIFTQVKQFICSSLSEEESKKLIVNQSPLPGYIAGTMLISKKRFEQIGPFVEEKILGEFIDWYLKALEKEIPMMLIPEVALLRRVHQDNMGRRDLSRRSDYLKILKASLDRRRALA